MIDMWNFLWIIPFCVSIGFVFSLVIQKQNKRNRGTKQIEYGKEELSQSKSDFDKNAKMEQEKASDFMMLRNGFGVTREKDPTFAEQWVNIMNFTGESQTEENYEESENG